MNANNSGAFISKIRHFSAIFCDFFESALNLDHFRKKITIIAYVFKKLATTKDVLRQMSKSSRLTEPLNRGHGKRAETLIQS